MHVCGTHVDKQCEGNYLFILEQLLKRADLKLQRSRRGGEQDVLIFEVIFPLKSHSCHLLGIFMIHTICIVTTAPSGEWKSIVGCLGFMSDLNLSHWSVFV